MFGAHESGLAVFLVSSSRRPPVLLTDINAKTQRRKDAKTQSNVWGHESEGCPDKLEQPRANHSPLCVFAPLRLTEIALDWRVAQQPKTTSDQPKSPLRLGVFAPLRLTGMAQDSDLSATVCIRAALGRQGLTHSPGSGTLPKRLDGTHDETFLCMPSLGTRHCCLL